MSTPSLSVTRPSSVRSEHTVDWVKCDAGDVWCHQHVASQSINARGRSSRRYWGLPSERWHLAFPREADLASQLADLSQTVPDQLELR